MAITPTTNLDLLQDFLSVSLGLATTNFSLNIFLEFESPNFTYYGENEITPYAMPMGWQYDFVKSKKLNISVENAILKDSFGINVNYNNSGESTTFLNNHQLLLTYLELLRTVQNKYIPILLITQSFKGFVNINNFTLVENGNTSYFSANFIQTELIKTFEKISFQGQVKETEGIKTTGTRNIGKS